MAVNAEAPGILGEEAARIGAWVLHYSTDYVFDGGKPEPYIETDATYPLSVYGLSKREGEIALQKSGAQHLILRSGWMLGAHGDNFARKILRLAAEKSSLDVVADQFGTPTSAKLLADLTAQLVEQAGREEADFPFGLYHVTSSGKTNWCDYARFVVAEARAAGKTLKLAPDGIRAVAAADYPLPAIRPHNSVLDTGKFCRTFGLPLPDWQTSVRQVLQKIFAE
jgi:dTDP-4-dehydrorhamnose reductase